MIKIKKIIPTMVLGLIGVTTVHAANLAPTGPVDPMTGEIFVTTTITFTAADTWEQAGTNITIGSGGSVSQTNGRFRVGQSSQAVLTIDGGNFSAAATDDILIGNSGSGSGTIDLIAGTLNISTTNTFFIGRQGATGVIRIQGGVATFGTMPSFDAAGGGNGSIDFTAMSTGTLTVTGANEAYYQALYTAGDLTLGTSSSADFDDVFEVSGSTLSLVAVPEPSSAAFLSLGAFALLLRRKK